MSNAPDGRCRSAVRIGLKVGVILKRDQTTARLTHGIVAQILTNSSYHPRGIKVRLSDGQVGRVGIIFQDRE